MEKYYWTMLPDSLAGKEAAHFVDFHPRLFSAIDFAYGNKLTLVKGDQKTSMRHKHEYLPGEYEIIVDALDLTQILTLVATKAAHKAWQDHARFYSGEEEIVACLAYKIEQLFMELPDTKLPPLPTVRHVSNKLGYSKIEYLTMMAQMVLGVEVEYPKVYSIPDMVARVFMYWFFVATRDEPSEFFKSNMARLLESTGEFPGLALPSIV